MSISLEQLQNHLLSVNKLINKQQEQIKILTTDAQASRDMLESLVRHVTTSRQPTFEQSLMQSHVELSERLEHNEDTLTQLIEKSNSYLNNLTSRVDNLTTQFTSLEAHIKRLDLSEQIESLKSDFNNLPNKLIQKNHLDDLAKDLDKRLGKLTRTQFKTNSLNEGQIKHTENVLDTLQDLLTRRDDREKSFFEEARQEKNQLHQEAREEFAKELFPILDGLEAALKSGEKVLQSEKVSLSLPKGEIDDLMPRPPQPPKQGEQRGGIFRRRGDDTYQQDYRKYKEEEKTFKQLTYLRNELESLYSQSVLSTVNSERERSQSAFYSWLEGLEFIRERCNKLLAQENIVVMNPLGENFDPNIHSGIEKVERDDVTPNTIIEVIRKGYRQRDHILRFPDVVVARAKKSIIPIQEVILSEEHLTPKDTLEDTVSAEILQDSELETSIEGITNEPDNQIAELSRDLSEDSGISLEPKLSELLDDEQEVKDNLEVAVSAESLKTPPLEIPVEDMLVEDVDALVEDVTGKDVTVEDVTVEDVTVEDVTVEDVTVEDIPVEDIPVEDIPVEDIPVEDIPVEDIPVEDIARSLEEPNENPEIALDSELGEFLEPEILKTPVLEVPVGELYSKTKESAKGSEIALDPEPVKILDGESILKDNPDLTARLKELTTPPEITSEETVYKSEESVEVSESESKKFFDQEQTFENNLKTATLDTLDKTELDELIEEDPDQKLAEEIASSESVLEPILKSEPSADNIVHEQTLKETAVNLEELNKPELKTPLEELTPQSAGLVLKSELSESLDYKQTQESDLEDNSPLDNFLLEELNKESQDPVDSTLEAPFKEFTDKLVTAENLLGSSIESSSDRLSESSAEEAPRLQPPRLPNQQSETNEVTSATKSNTEHLTKNEAKSLTMPQELIDVSEVIGKEFPKANVNISSSEALVESISEKESVVTKQLSSDNIDNIAPESINQSQLQENINDSTANLDHKQVTDVTINNPSTALENTLKQEVNDKDFTEQSSTAINENTIDIEEKPRSKLKTALELASQKITGKNSSEDIS